MTNSNPFSTRFVRPGAVPYLFARGGGAEPVVERLAQFGWRGQIVGPHGSGKSTLLHALLPHLEQKGRQVCATTLHLGHRRLPQLEPPSENWTDQTQVVIDGYEQLSWLSRWRLLRNCRRNSAGLLVTAHQDMGLPQLFSTQTSLALALRVVKQLTSSQSILISEEEVARCFQSCSGNLRETLFMLYDLIESQRPIATEEHTDVTTKISSRKKPTA